MRKKRFKISAILSLFLCLAVCIAAALFVKPVKPRADLANDFNTIADIVESDSNAFIEKNLKILYQKISGNSDATLQTLENLTSGTTSISKTAHLPNRLPTALDAQDMIKNNGDVEFFVTVAGKVFRPVYLTRSISDDVILTLLLADPSSLQVSHASWGDTDYTYTESNPLVDSNNKYPFNIYTYSKIRVETLNIGGQYATGPTTLSGTVAPSTENEWARFTLSLTEGKNGEPALKNGIADYLAAPSEMKYQQVQSFAGLNTGLWFNIGNEAWGSPYVNGNLIPYWFSSWENATGYSDWKNDKVWLPSITEVGGFYNKNYSTNDRGIFDLFSNQRSYINDIHATWTRSGQTQFNTNNNGPNIVDENSSGAWYYYAQDNAANILSCDRDVLHVCPAIHLNLTAASKHLSVPDPISETKPYSGSNITVDVKDYSKLEIDTEGITSGASYSSGVFSAKNASENDYVLGVTPKDGYVWASDGTNKRKEYKIHIDKGNLTDDIIKYDDTFAQDNQVVHHNSGKTKLELPKANVILPDATTNYKIYYKKSEYHPPTTTCPNTHPFPEPSGNWSEDIEEVSDTGGYLVYYKIVDENGNYNDYLGWFKVHIVTENITLTLNTAEWNKINSMVYGSAEAVHKSETLWDLLKDNVTILDQDDNPDTISLDEVAFYLLDKNNKDMRLNTALKYYPVGEYTIGIQQKNEETVKLSWDGGAPKFNIIAKAVDSLIWSGNDKWNEQKEKLSASERSVTDDSFNWLYDGQLHAPTAEFTGVDGNKISAKIEVENNDTVVGRYKATATTDDGNYSITGAEQYFYIRKTQNAWTKQYTCDGWSIGDGGADKEHFAAANFGTVVYEYHNGSKGGDIIPQSSLYTLKEKVTVFVVYKVIGTDNYDGLPEEVREFDIVDCTHPDITSVEWQHGDDSGHFRVCTKCGTKLTEPHVPKTELGTDDNQHWTECEICGRQSEFKSHEHLTPGKIINPADCKNKGLQIYSCICGHTTEIELDKTEHNPNTQWHTNGTNHWYECVVCGEHIGEVTHTPVEDPAHTATCVLPGNLEGSHCDICGEVIVAVVEIPALGHNIVGEPTIQPTCTTAGKKSGECVNCHQQVELAIPALGHTLAHHTEKEATETENGNIEYWNCSVCGKCFNDGEGTHEISEANTIVPALGSSGGISGGLSGGATGGSNDFLKDNWWWIVLIVGVLILLMLLFIIITTVNSRRRDRERQRQFDTLIKMQMMHYGFGQGGYQAGNTADETMHVEGQPRAQLPYSQEMIDVAVAAAMSALNQMNEKKSDTSASADSGKSVHDADGFYENYKPDDDNNE